MKKEKLSEVGYLILTTAIAFFVIISVSKMSNKHLNEKAPINKIEE
tara:strand:+ start:215 stop:352 length:138 start_codon:yes stop_codon:yes gene_type:complete